MAAPLLVEPVDDLVERGAVGLAVEARVGVHDAPVARVRQLVVDVLRPLDHAPDLQAEFGGERVVAIVVTGDGHDRAGPVLHQHVVGDEHRDALAVDRIDDRAPQRDAGLLALDVPALFLGLRQRAVDVLVDRLLVLGARRELEHVGVLGRHHEERRPEQRVRARGEHGVVDAHLGTGERHLRALGAPDPVALHGLDVLGPADGVQVVEQPVRVVGDAEEPLLELARLHGRAAALAAPVDHLLVRQHRGVLGTPVDRRVAAVRQPALEQPQEDPLRPAVVARLVRAELARPVDRDPPLAELALEGGDRRLGGSPGVLAGLDRVVLRRQPERVVAHRVQHPMARAPVEVGDRVADRIVLQVPDVGLAGRVRQHLEHVGLPVRRVIVVVGHLPRALALPDRLPFRLDRARVVAVLGGHRGGEVIARWQSRFSVCNTNSVRPVLTPTAKGAIAEAVIAAEAVKAGIDGAAPSRRRAAATTSCSTLGDRMLRVQCKSGRRKGGVVAVHDPHEPPHAAWLRPDDLSAPRRSTRSPPTARATRRCYLLPIEARRQAARRFTFGSWTPPQQPACRDTLARPTTPLLGL